MHNEMPIIPVQKQYNQIEITSSEPTGFIFWRLPEEIKRHNRINLEDLGKNIARILRPYANQFPQFIGKNYEDIAEQFCQDFFLANFDEHIYAYLANLSLTDNADKRISLSIRIPAHPIFNEHLPPQIAVAVIGYCPTATNNPIFIPEKVVLTYGQLDSTAYESEIQAQFQFLQAEQYPPRHRQNLLHSEFTQSLPKYAVKTKERLASWLDFLRFKNNLVKHKSQGLRYLTWQFDEDTGQVQFIVMAENEIVLKEARSAFNRQNLHAFTLNVSTDPYRFNLKQNSDRVESSFAGLGQLLVKDGIQKITEEQDGQLLQQVRTVAQDLFNQNDEKNEKQGKLNSNQFDISNAVFAKVMVEISEDLANTLAQFDNTDGNQQDGNKQTRQEKIDQLFKKLPKTGFLAVSLVGDLALIRRHERAVKNLQQNEGCYAPYLSSYLFDIKNANVPDEIVSITDWHNTELNDKQKLAVQKMLSAPDICLIQGPPGTGKTTVIAEACLQFAKRGETVLLASQAHDALDNALSRLKKHPELRAIRLAKSANRITDEGKEFTGESVLAKHYEALKNHLTHEYLSPIEQLQQRINHLQKWKNDADFIVYDLLQLHDKYKHQNDLLKNEQDILDSLQIKFDGQMKLFNQQTKYIELIDVLLNVLNGKQLPQALLSMCGQLPESILPLAKKISQLDVIKVKQSFSYELLMADTENQVAMFVNLWTRWIDTKNQYKQMRIDLENLKNQKIGQLTDVQTKLKIEQLNREIDEIAQRMEEEDNDALTDLWRQKRRELKTLKDNLTTLGGLNPDTYQIFEDREVFAQSNDVEGLKTLLTQRLHAVATIAKEVNLLIENIISLLNNELQNTELIKPSDEKIKQQQNNIEKIQTQLDEILLQGRAKKQQSKQCLLDGGFEPEENFIEIVQQQESILKDLNRELESIRSQNQAFLPLFEHFNQILDNPIERANNDWSELEKPFVESCNLVAITCNENEKTLSENNFDGFDVVIIDEVSKATPLELLLPLMRGKKAILVGDHRQLPPIFNEADGLTFEDEVEQNENQEDKREFSNTDLTEENLKKYEKMVTASLFKELFEQAPNSLRERLTIQFRMHPEIMKMINYFYEGALECGNPDKDRTHNIQFKGLLSKEDHLLWIDTTDDEQGKRFKIDEGQGNINRLEARMIARTLVEMNRQLEGQGYYKHNKMKVGVASFYQPQCRVIREEIRKITGKTKGWFSAIDVEINTVIRYQGKEKPIILLSLVKNNGGDLNQRFHAGRANIARFEFINVAMSRAQNLLLVFGARNMLENREVRLPRMDKKGFDKKMVYKSIFKFLEHFSETGGICSVQEFTKALPNVSGSQKKGNQS